MRDAVVNNWPMKLTALAVATVLWAVLRSQEPATQLIPVSVDVETPAGRALTRDPPDVQAQFTGPARELFKLYTSKPRLRVVVPDVPSSSYLIDITPQNIRFSADASVQIQDVRPRQIEVHLDSVTSRTVPVASRVTIQADTGFQMLGTVTVRPRTVEITGPEGEVRAIDSVPTVRMVLGAQRTDITRRVPLDSARLGIVRATPESVTVSARISEITTRVLSNVPVTVLSPDGTSWLSETAAVLVQIRGPLARIERFIPDSVAVTARPTVPGEAHRVPLRVRAPVGVTARPSPDSVVVRPGPAG